MAKAKDSKQIEVAEEIYHKLLKQGISVILDDRADKKTGFGVKMKDFELIGFPYAIIVGNDIRDGKVELIRRDNLLKEKIALDSIVEKVT